MQRQVTEQMKNEGRSLSLELNEVSETYGREPFMAAALIACASVYIVAKMDHDEFISECREAFGDAQAPNGLRAGSSQVAAALRMDEEEKALTIEAVRELGKLTRKYNTFVYFHTTLVFGAYLSLEAGDSEAAFLELARKSYAAAARQLVQPVVQA
jgi:hypothetical protein